MTNEDIPEAHYTVVYYDEEEYHFMEILSDVFAEAVAEHLGNYREDISVYISTEQPEFDLEQEHPELYDDLKIETIRLVYAMADASVAIIENSLKRDPPVKPKGDRSHLRVVK
tara:strand:- start:2559 stop:2897 length:339 start_codon:yes stop_codon:yes gene_type:complete